MLIHWTWIVRLLAAGLAGGLIGLEREVHSKDVGIRTHFLVALGSALFMLISKYAFSDVLDYDASRVAAQVVSGIGFIGAGTIIFQKNSIKGITTAAGIWVTAAVGLACGAGMWVEAFVSVALVVTVLITFNLFHSRLGKKNIALTITAPTQDKLRLCFDYLAQHDIDLSNYSLENNIQDEGDGYTATVKLSIPVKDHISRVFDILEKIDGVRIDSIE